MWESRSSRLSTPSRREVILGVVTHLEPLGLVETWLNARGRNGRGIQLEPTVEPEWLDLTVAIRDSP